MLNVGIALVHRLAGFIGRRHLDIAGIALVPQTHVFVGEPWSPAMRKRFLARGRALSLRAMNGVLTHYSAQQCESIAVLLHVGQWNRFGEPDMTSTAIYVNRGFLFRCASLLLFAGGLCLVTACVSPKYQRAVKSTPPIQPLNAKFPTSTLDTSLYSEISDGGPGSWKREAFWDEYVLVMHNDGDQALEISSATLMDYAGQVRPAPPPASLRVLQSPRSSQAPVSARPAPRRPPR
jgi:hypothetical protein